MFYELSKSNILIFIQLIIKYKYMLFSSVQFCARLHKVRQRHSFQSYPIYVNKINILTRYAGVIYRRNDLVATFNFKILTQYD